MTMADSSFEHGLPKSDKVDDLVEMLRPLVEGILLRVDADEFTTNQFIEAMLTDPDALAAYHQAIVHWGETESYGKMVIHGQVIPAILRQSALVEWAGYAHGEDDTYSVPAWWRLRRS